MDMNGDLASMCHVGHLRTNPECVRGLWIEKNFFSDPQIPQNVTHVLPKVPPNVQHGTFSVRIMDYGLWNIPASNDPEILSASFKIWHYAVPHSPW